MSISKENQVKKFVTCIRNDGVFFYHLYCQLQCMRHGQWRGGCNNFFKMYFLIKFNLYKMWPSKWCNFLYYTPHRSTVEAGPEMPKQRRLSVELWKKTPAWKWRCPIMCRIKIYLKGSSKTKLLFIMFIHVAS